MSDTTSVLNRVSEQRKEVVDAVITKMADDPEYFEMWTRNCSPMNGFSGKQYHGRNRLLLSVIATSHGYTSNRWFTFRQVNQLGGHVIKGSKSAAVEKWVTVSFDKETTNQDGTSTKETVRYPKCVGCWSVFNADEIDGLPEEPSPSLAHVTDDLLITADELIASSCCPIIEGTSDDSYFDMTHDEVHVPSRDSFVGVNDNEKARGFIHVLLHEMTHSTGTNMRLNRNVTGAFGTPKYAFEELVAEFGSVFGASSLGIGINERDITETAAYVNSWVKLLRDDPDAIFRASTKADQAIGFIVDRMNDKGWMPRRELAA